MIADLNTLKAVAGVIGDEDDMLLTLCLQSAVQYMLGAGVRMEQMENDLAALAACMLATHYYDNRAAVGGGDVPIPLAVRSAILQLRYSNEAGGNEGV